MRTEEHHTSFTSHKTNKRLFWKTQVSALLMLKKLFHGILFITLTILTNQFLRAAELPYIPLDYCETTTGWLGSHDIYLDTENQMEGQLKYLLKKNRDEIKYLQEKNRNIMAEFKARKEAK